MARVNIEQKAFTDARFATMGRLIGTSRYDALGRMALVWNHCQEVEQYVLPQATVRDLHPDVPNIVEAMVEAGLAVKMGRDGLYIRGTRGRVEWLADRRETGRENGPKGGRPKKTQGGLRTVTKKGSRQKTPPAPAPAPAPAGSGEKETSNRAGVTPLPSLARFDFLLEKHRQFHEGATVREMQAADPRSYELEFELAIGYKPAEFERLREQMAEMRMPVADRMGGTWTRPPTPRGAGW